MEYLLSGLVGALIATLLSVAYLYISEQAKVRTEVALEVVEYCDDVYNRLQFMHAHKQKVYADIGEGLEPEVYTALSRELTVLVKASKTNAKLAIVYGPAESVEAMNELRKNFQNAASLLWSATMRDWEMKSKQILDLFEESIDPKRSELEQKLIEEAKVTAIVKGFIDRLKSKKP